MAAEQHFSASYTIREAFDDKEGMALALLRRGDVARWRGAHAAANDLYERSRSLCLRIGDRGGVAAALDGLGASAHATGAYNIAARHFRSALEIAAAIPYEQLIARIVVHSCDQLLALGRVAELPELLDGVQRHPAATHETRVLTQQIRERSAAARQPSPAAATERGHEPDLRALHERVSALLAQVAEPDRSGPGGPVRAPPQQPLVEPLTERERTILSGIAEGHLNREIADTLLLSVGTVKWYTAHIYGKLGVKTRVQAAARARELNLLP